MFSFPSLEPVRCSMSGSNRCFLTCVQISQEAGQVVWYSHLLWKILQDMGITDHLIKLTCRVHHKKLWAGWSTSWNQDCWEDINNLRYANDTTLKAESEEELKSLLMKVKEESEKVRIKLNIQKTKIMASSPISSWQIDGKTMETVTGFIFLGSKISADGGCSHDIKRSLLLGRKDRTNLDNILKSRVTLLTLLLCQQRSV